MYIELCRCITCAVKFAELECHCCKLLLYCSTTCAIESSGHPCDLACDLLKTDSCTAGLWSMSVAWSVLDQLFCRRNLLSFESFYILVANKIPASNNAFNYLWHRVCDFFVWPHEKEQHLHKIKVAANMLSSCYPIINPHFQVETRFDFKDYIGILSAFVEHNADKFVCLLNSNRLVHILLDSHVLQFEFLISVVQSLSLPLLYQLFERLKNLQIRRDNSSLYKSYEGSHCIIPPLNIENATWKKAMEMQARYILPRGFIFSKNKILWAYALKQFQRFKNRKDFLLFLCLSRNKYLVLLDIPPYQDWSWCTLV